MTVVIPVKDRAQVLGRALASIASQTQPPREVVVVDDGSTDDTAAVAERAGVRVIRLPHGRGPGLARNEGIGVAMTEWVAFLDSDDEWAPQHLARLVQEAEGRVLVTAPGRSTGGRLVGNTAGTAVALEPLTLLVPGDMVCTSGTMVRTAAVKEAGSFRPLQRAEDLDLWIRVLELGPGVALPEPSVTYHEHAQQVSHDRAFMRECFDQLMREYADRPWMSARAFDASYSRWRWDDLRAAQRSADLRVVAAHARWFVGHPHTLPVLVELLRRRRAGRRTAAAR